MARLKQPAIRVHCDQHKGMTRLTILVNNRVTGPSPHTARDAAAIVAWLRGALDRGDLRPAAD